MIRFLQPVSLFSFVSCHFQKQRDIDAMERKAIKMANDLHAEFWCVSAKTGR